MSGTRVIKRERPNRRALTNVGGETRQSGDAALAAVLAEALAVESSIKRGREGAEQPEDLARAHVHGFHTYAARMHPTTARRLVEALSKPGDLVLDPFCGSGTVLVEAALAGRRAVGVDINPLGVLLARRKLAPTSVEDQQALELAASRVAQVADERRKRKAGPSRRYPPEDAAQFDPHVLLELDGLRIGIEAEGQPDRRDDLWLVLSAILIKLSRRQSDTADRAHAQRIAAGFPAKLFVRKAAELSARRALVAARLAAAPKGGVREGDARRLDGMARGSVDLVVTSPPYAGVYDYAAQHALRLRWLGLSERGLSAREIGSRRGLGALGPEEAARRWRADVEAVLGALARVVKPGGRAALLVGDGAVGPRALLADTLLAELAPKCGLTVVATASQPRPHFHDSTARAFAQRPREEHVVLLGRPADRPMPQGGQGDPRARRPRPGGGANRAAPPRGNPERSGERRGPKRR